MNPLRTRLAAAVIGAGLVIAAPVAAWAGPSRPVSITQSASTSENPPDVSQEPRGSGGVPREDDTQKVRTRCLAAIAVRLPALSAARAGVTANGHVTDDHEAALISNIDETAARLNVLAGEIKADTDLATLRDHCRSIFEDNRVFALVLPRTRLVVGADTAADAGAKLSDVAGKLADAIKAAEAAGEDVHQAKLDLDMMQAQIASGVAAAGSIPGGILGLTPADWNANHEALTPAHQSLREARTELKVARDLAYKIRHELRPTPASPQV
jgi:hypothetical protein